MLAFFRRACADRRKRSISPPRRSPPRSSRFPAFQPGPEPPRAWLFAIARNKLYEAFRSRRIQDEARRALAMEPIRLDDEAIEILEAATSAPAIQLLETLAPEQREAIEAHHFEERGYAEIAAELQCSESVVRKRVSRGLAALRAQLRQERPHA